MDNVRALPEGTRLEEYRIEGVLGAGGFGITYRGMDANLNKVLAIKEYLPTEFATRAQDSTVVPNSSADAADYDWGLQRFLDEARTLARFDHPHLNKVHRFFEANGTAYLVLEYVEGRPLSEVLRQRGTLPAGEVERLLADVLSGLADVHAAGYVHRDIKPGNLMLRPDGSAVVLDFGAARQAVGQRSKSVTSILTPGYAPIEQYDTKAEDVGPWSDIYALGMVAYRCISGVADGELPDAVTRARNQRKGVGDLAPAATVGKRKYDAKLLAAIDRAIEVHEEERPQSVAAWQAQLPGQGAAAVPPARREKTTPAAKLEAARHRAGWGTSVKVSLAVAGLAACAAVAIWFFPRFAAPPGPASGDPPRQTRDAPVASPAPTDDRARTPADRALAEWEEAKRTDTPAAYRAFIARHPGSPLIRLAEVKLAATEGAR